MLTDERSAISEAKHANGIHLGEAWNCGQTPDRSDRFATLLSHLSNLFPSDFDGELVLGEMRQRVFHLQRHWTMMRNVIRQVRDSNGLCHLRKIIEGMGGAVTVKEWSIQEPVIELD